MKITLILIFLVSIVIPVLVIFSEKIILPEVIDHILKRLPMNLNNIKSTLLNIVLGTFLEELIYRQIIQTILAYFIGIPFAIILTSTAFTLMHYKPGPRKVIFCDLFGIFIDSLLYGIIFSRSNILLSWVAHCISDLVGLTGLLIYKNNRKKN